MTPPSEVQGRWSGPQVAKSAGVDYRTFYNWVTAGHITPSIQAAEGSGHPAIYSDGDMALACRLALLDRAGMRVAAAAKLTDDQTKAVLEVLASPQPEGEPVRCEADDSDPDAHEWVGRVCGWCGRGRYGGAAEGDEPARLNGLEPVEELTPVPTSPMPEFRDSDFAPAHPEGEALREALEEAQDAGDWLLSRFELVLAGRTAREVVHAIEGWKSASAKARAALTSTPTGTRAATPDDLAGGGAG